MSLLVLYSYHHKNTEKIAKVFAKELDAQIKTPQQINPEELQMYNLIGGYMVKNTINFCLTLPINYHKSPNGKRSFFQQVQCKEKPKSPRITCCLGKNCKGKAT